MKKMLSTCIGVGALLFAALTAPAHAGGKAYSLWEYGGWVEAGIYGNNHGNRNLYDNNNSFRTPFNGGPGEAWNPASGNTAALGPARMADVQMNQAYGYIGKKIDPHCGWDIGGRVDFMYGIDAIDTQSNGLEYFEGNNDARSRWGEGDYLASLPQAYAEIGYRTLSVKAGKFYTPLGHESIMSTGRFFYSTSYAYSITPVTQTGALATWDANSRLSVYGGWTCGEDFSGYDQWGSGSSTFGNADNNAALFGLKYKVNRKINFGYGVLLGKDKDYWGSGEDCDYFVHSFIIGFQPNRCWDYTFEWALRNNDYGDGNFSAYGINQELIYKLNRCWAFGLRGEWMYENEFDANSYEVTLGANWTPNKWLLVRPEIRYDYCDGNDFGYANGNRAFDYGDSKDQFGFGVSTVVKF